MIRHLFLAMMAWFYLAVAAAHVASAGIMPERTRLVFHEGQTQRSLMLANTNAYPVVVQTWIDNGEGNQTPETTESATIALPSVFRLQPGALQGLRIIFDGRSLPKDRESVSWLNIYEIPPAKLHPTPLDTQVAVAMNTQMKIFYRPAKLPGDPARLAEALTFSVERKAAGWVLICHNPTPYHASFSSLRLRLKNAELPVAKTLDMMTAPFSDKVYLLEGFAAPGASTVALSYTLIDDGGHYQDGNATARVRDL